MHRSEFDPTYLPATAPAPFGGVDVLGLAPADGTDLCHLHDYTKEGAQTLRMSGEQARHLYIALHHTLKHMGNLPKTGD